MESVTTSARMLNTTGPENDADEVWAEEDDNFDGWEEAQVPSRALFPDDSTSFESAEQALEHAKAQGCDLRALVTRLQLDSFQVLRLINYIRRPSTSPRPTPASVMALTGHEAFLQDDKELQPVSGYEEDGLLQLDLADESTNDDPAAELQMLRQAYNELRRQYAERIGITSDVAQQDTSATAAPSSASRNVDAQYFESYAGHDIHQTMIADSVRTLSYAKFLLSPENAHLLRGKTVMDVGCGSGILSLFCARAGAKQVLAIDASPVAARAEANVRENGFSHVVRVYRGKMEELDTQLASYVGQVDVLVSEWMGYFLLYESMLPSVLYARDRYLRPEGILAPSHSRMLLAAATDCGVLCERQRFWQDVYGFRMPSMTEGLMDEAATEEVEAEAIVSDAATICDLPLETLPVKQPEFVSPFRVTVQRDCTVHGFVSWFDTWFAPSPRLPFDALPPVTVSPVQPSDVHGLTLHGSQVVAPPNSASQGEVVSFTTSPFGKQTHWKQTIFLLKTPIDAKQGTTIQGEIRVVAAQSNERELDVELHYGVDEDKRPAGEKRVATRMIQVYSVR
ncbi:protein arginine n-methyltransferase [Malassezia pachydermatis]|uniref:type I protein arginine methyltransferase n=1 Tax=Malassezia pachydermatis TaxID=77020 RepID=A0A0M9VP40_9BASI|nr:protein arginine n-methyltransferase [Malassezia pachydermatis]KOS14023.1 protein arginine n-methyltransferase [Malassezia pachydermatis]